MFRKMMPKHKIHVWQRQFGGGNRNAFAHCTYTHTHVCETANWNDAKRNKENRIIYLIWICVKMVNGISNIYYLTKLVCLVAIDKLCVLCTRCSLFVYCAYANLKPGIGPINLMFFFSSHFTMSPMMGQHNFLFSFIAKWMPLPFLLWECHEKYIRLFRKR